MGAEILWYGCDGCFANGSVLRVRKHLERTTARGIYLFRESGAAVIGKEGYER